MSSEPWADDEDTIPTLDGAALERLRRAGHLEPAEVLEWGAASDVGRVRLVNEDAWGAWGDRLFVVADGMGGHAGGELASRTAVRAVLEAVGPAAGADLPDAVQRASVAVRAAGETAGVRALGTTLVALCFTPGAAELINVGDSRIYRFRADRMDLLTRDHTVRNGLLDAGIDPADHAQLGARLGGLTSFVGAAAERLAVQQVSIAVARGDRYLLCSDGVHRQLPEDALRRLVAAGSCAQAATALVQAAVDAGGRDNATAIVVELG